MSREATEQRIRAIVVRVSKKPVPEGFADDADVFRDLGVESTAALDLLLSLEEEFGVSIPDTAFNDARSVRALTDLIAGLP